MRVRAGWQSFLSDCIPIFAPKWVTEAHKFLIAQMLLASRILYNAHTWGPLSPSQSSKMHATYSRILRHVQGKQNTTLEHLCTDAQLYIPHTSYLPIFFLLRWRRLMYFVRVLLKAPASLKRAIQRESNSKLSWAFLIRTDLSWLRNFEGFSAFPDPNGPGMLDWEATIVEAPNKFRNKVKKLFKDISNGKETLEQGTSLRTGGNAPLLAPPLPVLKVKCIHCPYTCKPGQAMCAHMTRLHNYRSPEHKFAFINGGCRSCLRQFTTKPRLLAHLAGRKSQGSACFRNLVITNATVVTDAQQLEIQYETAQLARRQRAAGRALRATTIPVHSLPGPKPEPVHGPLPLWASR
jgi:hypothetical protein